MAIANGLTADKINKIEFHFQCGCSYMTVQHAGNFGARLFTCTQHIQFAGSIDPSVICPNVLIEVCINGALRQTKNMEVQASASINYETRVELPSADAKPSPREAHDPKKSEVARTAPQRTGAQPVVQGASEGQSEGPKRPTFTPARAREDLVPDPEVNPLPEELQGY